ncbi:hypothetical protein [Streptomyces sp. NPDC054952]
MLDGDVTLLAEFRDSYFGERSSFPNAGSYELAVNGRGIPDLDIELTGAERIEPLMRRGVSFAWDALHGAGALSWKPSMLARVSVEPTVMDPDDYTGYVTFFSAKFADEVGMGADFELPGIQVIMSSEDCATPLRD